MLVAVQVKTVVITSSPSFKPTRIYAFLAERYLSYWFQKYSKPLEWPIFFFDTNKNKIEVK